jgi:hypothetical protein
MPAARRDSRYSGLVRDVSTLLESARGASARAVNTLITATYWEIGRRIVEFEQGGARRAAYGTELLDKLSADLTRRFGRGFSRDNLETILRRCGCSTWHTSRERFPRRRLGSLRTLNIRDAVSEIRRRGGGRPVPPPLVALRAARSSNPLPRSAILLPDRGAPGRLVRPSARPSDRVEVLRAHGSVAEQGRNAPPWCQAAARGSRRRRWRDPRPPRPRVPRPQRRVLTSRRHSFAMWSPSSWSSAVTSPSLGASAGSGSVTRGIESTSCSSTDGCAVSW